ncbi:MAG: DUF3656 domain-containing protein [Bacilli bacterium]
MTELLSPVGNMECLMAAINGGCDAVYLAGKNFGARSFAGNFSNDELVIAVNICHLYGVKVYVTINTIIYDSEVERLINYVDFLHKINVDALIMQDIGMIDLIRKTFPNIEIHASTQANIHNLEGVKFCEQLGIKRVVLARETPIELIKDIKDNTNVELEIFIHGALCMSYSGECLMSALIGNRSGNRGTCAQCCRQEYSLEVNNKIVEKNKYLLSLKDLNTLENIGKLIDMGINSLKIEGRMKRPEYVFLVTSLYRKAIDNYKKYKETRITNEDIINLKKVFNREFTKGFIFNEENDKIINTYRPNHLGIEIGKVIQINKNKLKIKLRDELNINDGIRIIGNNDSGCIITTMFKNNKRIDKATKGDIIEIPFKEKVSINSNVLKTTDYYQLKEIEKNIKINKRVKIRARCILKLNSKIKLIVNDGINNVELESDYIINKAQNSQTTLERIKEQLSKLGQTVYEYENLEILKDDDIFVPINIINELRREILLKLDELRLYKIPYKKSEYYIDVPNFNMEENSNILVSTYKEYLKFKDKYNIIYIDDEKEFSKIKDKKCILKMPRINEKLKEYEFPILVSDLGSVYKYKNVDTDFSLNVANSYSVALLHSLGVNKITLSHELTYTQIEKLVNIYRERYNAHPNLEVITNDNIEAMVCKYNMLRKYKVDTGYLIDRFSNKYKIKIKNNLMHIYDYKRTNKTENYYKIGINNIRKNI